jgi:hypothetical protein
MKKVLFIGPKFYNFEVHIIKAIEKLNFDVDFYDEKPELNIKFRIIQKMPKIFFDKYLDVYYKSIVSTTKQYDFIFIIRAEMIKKEYLEVLKKNQKKAKFIMYQWDFYDNLPNIKSQIQFFDDIYTFDANDAKNNNFILKPLFFTNEHKNKSKETEKSLYKISFIGSHHSDRLEFIKKFMKINNLTKKDFFYHLFRPKLSYIYNKYIARNNIGDIKYKEVQSTIINEKETIEILSSSEMILDIHHIKQAGLTIRSLEALGLKKKLITTNPLIVDYDFYNKNNICLINRNNPIIPKSFFQNKYEDIPDNIYNSYCVDEWVKEFFMEEVK